MKISHILHHKAGEQVQLDWSGERPQWIDPMTGEIIKGVLLLMLNKIRQLLLNKFRHSPEIAISNSYTYQMLCTIIQNEFLKILETHCKQCLLFFKLLKRSGDES